MKHLVLGGVKSGKSKFAEQLAESVVDLDVCSTISLVATAQALDDEMAERIARHKEDRPPHWCVVEEPILLSNVLENNNAANNVLVVDCLTLWITNLLMLEDDRALDAQLEQFLNSVERYQGELILVSNETNMGIMPLGELSRRYCDVAGTLHKKLAQLCDKVDLLVAGLPMSLKPGSQCSCSTAKGSR